MNQLKIKNLYDLAHTAAKPLLEKYTFPWEALPEIGSFIKKLGESLDPAQYERKDDSIWVSKTARIYPNTCIAGPAIIGHNTEVRPGAFIRGNVLVGDNCVVGNSTELKNVILFNNVQVPHYNYVGDSILGHYAHMGAGAVTSNVKQDKSPVTVYQEGTRVDTGLKKFGAMLGDHVEVGCNSVLNPGTVIGRNSRIYPLSMVRGVVPEGSIHKNNGTVIEII